MAYIACKESFKNCSWKKMVDHFLNARELQEMIPKSSPLFTTDAIQPKLKEKKKVGMSCKKQTNKGIFTSDDTRNSQLPW
jgi:hypothetical protein